MKTIVRFLDFCSDFTNEHFDRLVTAGIILLLVMAASVPLVLLLGPVNPVITVETPYGIATISGPGAEYVLHSAFPIKH